MGFTVSKIKSSLSTLLALSGIALGGVSCGTKTFVPTLELNPTELSRNKPNRTRPTETPAPTTETPAPHIEIPTPTTEAPVSTTNSPIQLSTDCYLRQDLPLVTHWSNTLGPVPGASEQIAYHNPNLNSEMSQPGSLKYVYNFNLLPRVGNYGFSNVSLTAIPDNEARTWIENLCRSSRQAFQFWKPTAFNGDSAIKSILSDAPERSGVALIISGLTVSQSMFTIFLPANWKAPDTSSQAPYPILFNGFYDINDNLIRIEGVHMGSLIAKSAQNNGSGAIGVLWNGGGSTASRTVNPQAWDEFQKVIGLVARLGGDRNRILAFGGSRGGMTPLQMASNPNPHNYVFRYIDAGVPGGHLGTVALVASPTIPGLIHAADWSVGFADAHKKSFIYPNVGNGLHGLNSYQSHLMVLTGVYDPRVADAQYSLGSPAFIQALKNAGTQIFLELGTHDFIVPSFDQIWLYRQYVKAGIPVELKYNYLAGHHQDITRRQARLEKQMKMYTHGTAGGTPKVQSGKIQFYRVDSKSGTLLPSYNSNFLFTLEVPRYLSPEVNGVIVATGMPNAQVELTIQYPDQSPHTFYQRLNEYGYHLLRFSPTDIPTGIYKIARVRIKNPDDNGWRDIPLNSRSYKPTSANEPLIIENLATHPDGLTGADTTTKVMDGYLGARKERVIGSFSGVSYGLAEPSP